MGEDGIQTGTVLFFLWLVLTFEYVVPLYECLQKKPLKAYCCPGITTEETGSIQAAIGNLFNKTNSRLSWISEEHTVHV